MAAIDFPTATSNGQTFEADSGVIYTYVGTPPNGFWSGTFGTTGLTTLDGRYIAKNDSNTIQTIQTQGLKFNSGSADTILIDGLNSKIGIGTTSVSNKLVISDGSNNNVEFSPGSTNTLLSYDRGGAAYLPIRIRASSHSFANGTTDFATIDSSGRVGIGLTPHAGSGYALQVDGGASSFLQFFNDTTGETINDGLVIGNDSSTAYIVNKEATPLTFRTSNTERMRIDSSGNVGIGTTNPLVPFVLSDDGNKNIEMGYSSGTSSHYVQAYNRSTSAYAQLDLAGSVLTFKTPTESMRIDSSGKVGIGTTSPSSSNISANQLVVADTSSACGITIHSSSAHTGNIFFADGTSGSAVAEGYVQYNHASNDLIFGTSNTEQMRIDSSGRVGIGTTSMGSLYSGGDDLVVGDGGATNQGMTIYTGTSQQGIIAFADGSGSGAAEYAGYVIYDHSGDRMTFATTGQERMRIDSSGELLIGTTHSNGLTIGFAPTSVQQNGILYSSNSPFTDTNIYGCGLSGAWKGRIKFYTSNNSAASLAGFVDEEGNLALGRTNFSVIAYSQTSGDGQWLYRRSSGTPNFNQGSVIQSTNADGGWAMMYLNKFAWNTGDDQRYLDLYKNGQTHARLQLTANGANVELTNQSDYRLKENVEPYTGGLDAIKALRVCQFDWISNPSYPYKTVGFIAHEVDEILDDIVTGVKDGTKIDEGGNEVAEYQSLDQSRLVPYLTSALQEAIAKIETLELPNKNPINIRQTTSLLNNPFITFLNSSGDTAGSIIQNGVNSVTYATSSDYRLKDNVVELTAAIPRLKQLAPKRFNFTAAADVTVDGFLAHEAQAVVPEAVTGSHNQVDGDGNPVMQGIDQSKLVPLLTAALQEAIGRIETLETRIAALEGS